MAALSAYRTMNNYSQSTAPSPNRLFVTVVGFASSEINAFITTLSERGINDFGMGRIAIDEDIILLLQGTEDTPVFSRTHDHALFGYIVLFDGTNPERFWEVKGRLAQFQEDSPSPFVAAALFENKDQFYTESTLRAALALPDSVPLVNCVRHDRDSQTRVLLALLYQVIEKIRLAEHSGKANP